MSPASERHPNAKKSVHYRIPGFDDVVVKRDEPYKVDDIGALTMDLYYPPGRTSAERTPAVVIAFGYSDARMPNVMGCTFKEMDYTTSWARLLAASGMVTIAYTNREPAADAAALVDHIRENAASLGIDGNRIGLWAGSANVALALWLLMRAQQAFRCAALCYGYTLDLDGSTAVGDAARMFGYATPAAGRSVDDLPTDVPLFVARAGREQFPGLNEALDRFVAKAVGRNLPLTLVNHASGPHGFDVEDDTDTTREVIRHILRFMQFHLRAS